jgi:hypothetical protein
VHLLFHQHVLLSLPEIFIMSNLMGRLPRLAVLLLLGVTVARMYMHHQTNCYAEQSKRLQVMRRRMVLQAALQQTRRVPGLLHHQHTPPSLLQVPYLCLRNFQTSRNRPSNVGTHSYRTLSRATSFNGSWQVGRFGRGQTMIQQLLLPTLMTCRLRVAPQATLD